MILHSRPKIGADIPQESPRIVDGMDKKTREITSNAWCYREIWINNDWYGQHG